MKNNGKQVSLTDKMVLTGIAFGIIYWIIETFLYVISSYELNISSRLFGPDLAGVCTRVVVLCLFIIFGSHVQYTFNQKKRAEAELKKTKELNEQLQQEIADLKSKQT